MIIGFGKFQNTIPAQHCPVRKLHCQKTPSLSRGGLGWGWVFSKILPQKQPIPLLTSPLKGEE
jgi:hypothetical protein